ncbi:MULTISPECIES: DUF262 domain-containing protein [Aminobacter]|uniref:DUF262 domain-containing protein n=1 Tax=Aminobacter ciceronei TaxID=150723 RepID=A0ABR6CHK2_9HYPH|nr:DUF262 domain-containing protein [Aminobacter ciceronei]MBA8910301.1 hypothetical protein [Aminobacter ciceronei]MBA9024045.1 hypothetical protein [Aminobacter ciceronei]
MKIAPTALKLDQLLGSANEQFVIPAYQRRYSWRDRHVYELLEDIDLLEGADVHLLGSIVCLTGHHTPGINELELVDGQQRLSTICVLLECLRQRFLQDGDEDQARDVIRLLTAKAPGGTPVPKIALNTLDGDEFRDLATKTEIDCNAYQNHHLAKAFLNIRQWLSEKSMEELTAFSFKLQNQALVVRLDVSDAKDAFKLFETINNRGLRLSPTDIIKNFVLGNAARFGASQLQHARKEWATLISYLDGTDADGFFRYFLISSTQRRITKNQVVREFKTLFMNEVIEAKALPDRHLYVDEEQTDEEEPNEEAEIDDVEIPEQDGEQIPFAKFMERLVVSSKVFGQLVLVKTGNKQIDRHLRNLRMIKSAQTYGFLMHLRVGGIADKAFVQILKLTESFVLRRHICRERSNETETLFARLCEVEPTNPLVATKKAYRDACPTDEKFKHEFTNANFTSNIIERARYCLEQIEIRHHGKHAELAVLGAEDVHVEHIIPQKIKTAKSKREHGDWTTYLGEKIDVLHPRLVSRIGNLTLFAGELNITASNNPFAAKKAVYKQSSILVTQDLASMPAFRFKQVETRSSQLAELAVEYWPLP